MKLAPMGFKIAVINIIKNLKENINIMIKRMEDIRKEPNGNYTSEKRIIWNIKFTGLVWKQIRYHKWKHW